MFPEKKVMSSTQLLTAKRDYNKYCKSQILVRWFGERVDQLGEKKKINPVSKIKEIFQLILVHS